MKALFAIILFSLAINAQVYYDPTHDYEQLTPAKSPTLLKSGHQAFAAFPIGDFNSRADAGFEVSSGLNIRMSRNMTMQVTAGYIKFETGEDDTYAIPAILGFRRYLTTAYHGFYTGTEGGVMFFDASSTTKFFMAPVILGYEMDVFGVGVDPSVRIRFVSDDRYHATAGLTLWFGN